VILSVFPLALDAIEFDSLVPPSEIRAILPPESSESTVQMQSIILVTVKRHRRRAPSKYLVELQTAPVRPSVSASPDSALVSDPSVLLKLPDRYLSRWRCAWNGRAIVLSGEASGQVNPHWSISIPVRLLSMNMPSLTAWACPSVSFTVSLRY